ncbi:MAG: TolC family protein [Planctomycetaceae bacterium]|nr:TolC family protein [Planctomycetaceae bacterium]
MLICAALLTLSGAGCQLASRQLAQASAVERTVFRGQDPVSSDRAWAEQPDPARITEATLPLGLRGAIAMAMAHSDIIRTLDGIESVTGFDPSIAEARADAELGVFNPELRLGYLGSRINDPPASFFGPGLSTQTRRDEGDFSATVSKRWSLGTTTRAGYDPSMGYLFIPDSTSGGFNPAHEADFIFEIRQPLLRGFGHSVNLAPIRVAQLQSEMTRWEVEEATIRQVRSTEEAYWRLFAAVASWRAVLSVIPIAEESVRIEELRFQAERSTYADVARVKVQRERLRQQLASAQLRVWQRENQMRQLIGLPAEDSRALQLTDVPIQQAQPFDLQQAVEVAIIRRPDLKQRRLDVEQLKWRQTVAVNDKLPQLDARYLYRVNGLGNRLDDALGQAFDLDYTDWTVGLEFSVPLGNQKAKSRLRAAELELAREQALLREYERQVGYQVALLLSELQTRWELYSSAKEQTQQTQEWLRLATIRFSNPGGRDGGRNSLLAALDDFQTALQTHIDAQTAAADALADYNVVLARLSEVQGTTLDRWQIEFANEAIAAVPVAEAPINAAPAGVSMYSSYRTVGFGHSLTPASQLGVSESSQPVPLQSVPMQGVPTGMEHSMSIVPARAYHQNSVRR